MAKRKVLLIRVPEVDFRPESGDLRSATVGSLMVPLGITSLAAVIRERGEEEVFVFDLYAETYQICLEAYHHDPDRLLATLLEELCRKIAEVEPDLVGLSAVFLFQHRLVQALVAGIKEAFPALPVLLGGYPTLVPDTVLREIPGVDVAFIGEAERSLLQVLDLQDLQDDTALAGIDGIAFRCAPDGIVVNDRLNLPALEDLPYPAFDLLPLSRYREILGSRQFPLLTSRSCPFSCNFCSSYRYSGRRFRKREVADLLREMKLLRERYGLDFLWIRDENFDVDTNHAKSFLREVIKSGYQVPWMDSNGFHVNSMDEEFLDLCKESGCREVIFAVESGSPRVLKEIMNKDVDLEHALRMSEYCRKIGLSLQCYFVIGSPGETRDEIRQTIAFARRMRVEHCTFSIATPFPGTRYHEIALENGYLKAGDFTGMTYMSGNIDTDDFSAQWLKDTQYDANIDVNFLNNLLLQGGPDDLARATEKYGRIHRQYRFHAVARVIEGYGCFRLGKSEQGEEIFIHVGEMLAEAEIARAYSRYFEWDTPATNFYRQWLKNRRPQQLSKGTDP